MSQQRVHLVGHVTIDRLVRDGEEFVHPGGCVAYAARAHHALGARVTVSTAGTPDPFPPEVEVSRHPCGATTTFVNTYMADARAQTIETIGPELLPEPGAMFDVLHLAPVLGEVPLTPWLGRSRYVGLGLQGWLRRPEGVVGPGVRVVAGETPRISDVDVVFLSDEDLRGQGDLLERLRVEVPLVALTHGRNGVTLYSGRTMLRLPAVPVTDERDPTGAGDTFAAGALHQLALGLPASRAALTGMRLAAACVEHVGIPDVAALRAALEQD